MKHMVDEHAALKWQKKHVTLLRDEAPALQGFCIGPHVLNRLCLLNCRRTSWNVWHQLCN